MIASLFTTVDPFPYCHSFSRIFETIVFKYVLRFLDGNNILYEYQFGSRKHHSTSHAKITLVERITKAIATGKYIIGVFSDLKKAFDTVDHCILLNKLEKNWNQGQPTQLVEKLFVFQGTIC